LRTQSGELLGGEVDGGGLGADGVGSARARDRDHPRRLGQQPRQSDLLGSRAGLLSDLLKRREPVRLADPAEGLPRQERQPEPIAEPKLGLARPEGRGKLVLHRHQPVTEDAPGETDLLGPRR
jgi:hypothetical protein